MKARATQGIAGLSGRGLAPEKGAGRLTAAVRDALKDVERLRAAMGSRSGDKVRPAFTTNCRSSRPTCPRG